MTAVEKEIETDERESPADSPPGEEEIAGADGQPTEAAESEAAAAKSEKRNVSRRPYRPEERRHRAGPPCPPRPLQEPAAIVIRRPAPRLRRGPRPAPVRLP